MVGNLLTYKIDLSFDKFLCHKGNETYQKRNECRLQSVTTMSTQCTAAIMESTGPAFTDLSVKDYALGDGKEVNTLYGRKKRQPEKRSSMTSKLLLPKSSIASLKGSKESLKNLTITNLSKKRSLDVDRTYFDTLSAEYDAARSRAREWELHVYSTFSKRDQFSIMGILAYLENIERGFGRYNNEKVYASVRKDDISGQLFEEASRGFEFSKQYIALAPLVCNLKARRLIK